MHGGAQGSGAPRGNTNALKNGAYTRAAIMARRRDREYIREACESLKELK
jgi:glucans biosynthesis protein